MLQTVAPRLHRSWGQTYPDQRSNVQTTWSPLGLVKASSVKYGRCRKCFMKIQHRITIWNLHLCVTYNLWRLVLYFYVFFPNCEQITLSVYKEETNMKNKRETYRTTTAHVKCYKLTTKLSHLQIYTLIHDNWPKRPKNQNSVSAMH